MSVGLHGGTGFLVQETHFLGQAPLGDFQEVTENSGTAAVAATGVDHGVLTLTTGTSSGNRVGLYGELNWQADNGGPLSMEAHFACKTDIDAKAVFIGFTDTISIENPIEQSGTTITSNAADAAGFFYDTDSDVDNWHIAAVKANVDATPSLYRPGISGGNTGFAPVADQFARFRVVISAQGHAEFYMGALDAAGAAVRGMRFVGRAKNAVTATTTLVPVVLVEARENAANLGSLSYIGIRAAAPY